MNLTDLSDPNFCVYDLPNEWRAADIITIVGIALTFLINIHQSMKHKHFHSECCGNVFDVLSNNDP